jgi:hypothetical protein
MISISASMDEYDIAQEIRFERQVHKGSFLLLEGPDDLKRFSKFTDERQCSTVNCFGRSNLINAIKLLYEDGFAGALGLADADFDRLLGKLELHEGIIYSESHDFDMDWACESTLSRYLDEVGDKAKCAALGNAPGVAAMVFGAIKPLSILRYLNEHRGLRYKLAKIRHDAIVVDSVVDTTFLVEHVSQGAFSDPAKKQGLETLIKGHLSSQQDPLQLTNGHDFFALLGIALRDKIGRRLDPQSWRSEVQIHFRLTYSEQDLIRSAVYRAIVEWEKENPPYLILKRHLVT